MATTEAKKYLYKLAFIRVGDGWVWFGHPPRSMSEKEVRVANHKLRQEQRGQQWGQQWVRVDGKDSY